MLTPRVTEEAELFKKHLEGMGTDINHLKSSVNKILN
jgi:hypothetical protein